MNKILTFFYHKGIFSIVLLVILNLLSISVLGLNNNKTNRVKENNESDCCEKRGGSIDKPTKLIFTCIVLK